MGLQHSETEVTYSNNGLNNNVGSFGPANDPMVGLRIGGVNVFGGRLALYSASSGESVGDLVPS
jgi:hypothetical protein